MAQVIEQPEIFQQILIHRAGGGNLIGQSPHGNTRMIVTLGDQLPHLGQRVFPAILHVLSDIGDLCPHHNAVLVAQIIEFLSVLVMRQPQSVGTQLPDDGHIRRMILPGQRVALSLPVLVTADAPQRIAAAIEEEAFPGIASKLPAAEAGAGFIPAFQLSCRRIQIGIVHTIPQVDIFNDKFRLSVAVFRGYGFAFAMHGHGDS